MTGTNLLWRILPAISAACLPAAAWAALDLAPAAFSDAPAAPRVIHLRASAVAEAGGTAVEATGEYLIRLADPDGRIDSAAARLLAAEHGLVTLRAFPRLSKGLGQACLLVRAAAGDEATVLEALRRDPRVLVVQPNHPRRLHTVPDDTFFDLQWGLRNTGQEIDGVSGTPGADIDAANAWETTTGSDDVVVAVLDSGVDWSHVDLAESMWVNPWEIAGNEIDDDGNGFVDDVHGVDTGDGDGNPMDYVGHGTHVAGIIAARGNNARGVAGVAWRTRIMALKVANTRGAMSDASILEALEYLLDMRARGVNVVAVNASLGGEGGADGDLLHEAIRMVNEAGIVFTASAGNDGGDLNNPLGYWSNFPSSYSLPGIVAVAASDQDDRRAEFSNYGATSVDLAAPGVRIASTYSLADYEPAPADLFFDDMESGEAKWFHGGTGDTWAISGEAAASPTHAWSDSPGLPYTRNSSYLRTAGTLDLSPLAGRPAYLGFRAKLDLATDDLLRITITGATGTVNLTLAGTSDWAIYNVRLPESFLGPGVIVTYRIEENWDGVYGEGVWIDDVGIGHSGPSVYYANLSGTSMAAPMVTGALALLAAAHPGEEVDRRVNRLLSGVESVPDLSRRVRTGGRLDVARSLAPDLALRPVLSGWSPAGGRLPGSVLTLTGGDFGSQAGQVLFTDSLLPSFRTGDVRLRFDFLTWYSLGHLLMDDIRVGTRNEAAFLDDAEAGLVNWINPVFSNMQLTTDTWHSPVTAFEANHDDDGRVMQSVIYSATGMDLSGLDVQTPRLEWWGSSTTSGSEDRFAIWGSDNGGRDWLMLGEPSGYSPNWNRHELDLPDTPRPVAGRVLAWSDGEIEVMVPAGAGRNVTVIGANGREALDHGLVGAWKSGPPMVMPRPDAATVTLNGDAWCIGGGTELGSTDSVERFHPASGAWVVDSLNRLPLPRTGHAAAAVGGRIYVAGGVGAPARRVDSLRPGEGAWREELPLPMGLVGASAVGLGGRLYVLGGRETGDEASDSLSAALWSFDPAAGRWTRRADMVEARSRAAAVAIDGRILVFGGLDRFGAPLDSTEAWDPGSNTWTPLARLPLTLAGAGVATDGRRVYLVGGIRHDWHDGEKVFAVYDPKSNSWEYRKGGVLDLPEAREYPGLVYLPGYGLLTVGGRAAGMYHPPTDETQRLDVQRTYAKVTVLGPDGGVRPRSGSRIVIHWGAPPRAKRFLVEWSSDGGATWRVVSTGTRRTALTWTVPGVKEPAKGCRVRVTGFTQSGRLVGRDISDAPRK